MFQTVSAVGHVLVWLCLGLFLQVKRFERLVLGAGCEFIGFRNGFGEIFIP